MDRDTPRRQARRLGARASRGFTLIELVVTMGLLAIVLALLMIPVMNSLGYFRSATARADAQNAARVALDAMARELTEAMYVQLDMYDNSMIAFFPPLRVDPSDPNSEIVTPPRPDWSRAIRYWRALYDPTFNYNPGGHLGPGNTFFVARSVLPDPFATDDPWNRWNDDWVRDMNRASTQAVGAWSPISRLVHTDVDWRASSGQVGRRAATLQPGFPYLAVQHLLETRQIEAAEATRLYRNYVVALTPSGTDYDIPQLEFNPTVVSGEWLRPAPNPDGDDRSAYHARYPLWRLGAPYTGWAAFAEDQDSEIHRILRDLSWARDPFLLIYRYEPVGGGWQYALRGLGAFDPRTRTMKIVDATSGAELYDTGQYPYRPQTAAIAFGVDWIDGSLRCAFPPLGVESSMLEEHPMVISGSELVERPLVGGEVLERPLMPVWEARLPGGALSTFLIPESVRVSADTTGDGQPDRTLTQVFCTPRENSDEFQVGVDPQDSVPDDIRYGWLRVPDELSGGVDPKAAAFFVDFRWRSNGVVPAGGTLAQEKPDLISAYYRTAAVLDISITATKADPRAAAGQRVAQSVHMSRRVKLRNLLREIRYEE